MEKNHERLDLRERLWNEFQLAFASLCRFVNTPLSSNQKPVKHFEKPLNNEWRCKNGCRNHLNPSSHTLMTCLQQMSSCHYMTEFNQRYGTAFLSDQLITKCSTEPYKCERSDQGWKCADTGYKKCRAQKTCYFNNLPGMLVEKWRAIERYKSHVKSGISTATNMTAEQLRTLMINIVMSGFTVHWRRKDRY